MSFSQGSCKNAPFLCLCPPSSHLPSSLGPGWSRNECKVSCSSYQCLPLPGIILKILIRYISKATIWSGKKKVSPLPAMAAMPEYSCVTQTLASKLPPAMAPVQGLLIDQGQEQFRLERVRVAGIFLKKCFSNLFQGNCHPHPLFLFFVSESRRHKNPNNLS